MHKLPIPILGLLLLSILPSAAFATPPFFKQFQDLYAGPTAPDGYRNLVAQAKCNVCHVQGQKKQVQNPYGQALFKAGLRKQMAKDLKDPAKAPEAEKAIRDALEKVAKEKTADGDTYGERIKAGKLPAG